MRVRMRMKDKDAPKEGTHSEGAWFQPRATLCYS